MGKTYKNKAFSERFGFDRLRTSQLLYIQFVKSKATGTPLGMILFPHNLLDPKGQGMRVYIHHRRGAFSVARSDKLGNAKAFKRWNRATDLAPRFIIISAIMLYVKR